jgi:hypothetical protein
MASKRKAPAAKKAAKASEDSELVEVLKAEISATGIEFDDSAVVAVASAVKAYVSSVVVEAVSDRMAPRRLFFRTDKKKGKARRRRARERNHRRDG